MKRFILWLLSFVQLELLIAAVKKNPSVVKVEVFTVRELDEMEQYFAKDPNIGISLNVRKPQVWPNEVH